MNVKLMLYTQLSHLSPASTIKETLLWRSLPGSAGRTGCPLASSAIGPYSYEKVLVDGGFITAADMRYHFFVTDHLGNVRVVVNDAGVVEQVNQFYPYGEATDMGQALPASVDNPYKWVWQGVG